MKKFDIIVIGAGHAGIEAAYTASKMGCSVAMITMDKYAAGRMSCNPAIGGTAKGHLVREIDALGGAMGRIADKTGIQFRILNKSKGPAVWSSRCQSDRDLYSAEALFVISSIENLEIIEDSVTGIKAENNKIIGIEAKNFGQITSSAVILSSGTFLNGLMHTGLKSTDGGRFGEKRAAGITESLLKLGFTSGRLKTGTPPRLRKDSINWGILEEQPGDEDPQPFSHFTEKKEFPFLPQVSCYITYTDERVHKILEKGFDRSPMFKGLIKGVGPRYCPSIEDKIARFKDKSRHQLFLEPEGLNSNIIYLNGFSTSLPAEIQSEALRKIKGLEEAEMIRPGYAVEYDFFPPHQIDLNLETKLIEGLYFAGQINGTSGYEEAAAQGLVAGINAAAKIRGIPELVLKRSEAYIGVLIDDLVNKSTDEPYRMFTSRAEHRLLLRQDNADLRLMEYGSNYGLIPSDHYKEICRRKYIISSGIKLLEKNKLRPAEINPLLTSKGQPGIESAETISKLCKRPELSLMEILNQLNGSSPESFENLKRDPESLNQIEIEIKYEGYIKRQCEMIRRVEKYEEYKIPLTLNYLNLKSLSTEGREKLNRIRPRSIGQASRISGVTPSDISVLLVYLKN